uniref:HipA-like C-terminal domain-containing protein n=1 Tax=uncultured Bacillota bacterium TaxID=344338 RepID=A0A650EMU3_9FIRM|nr:hypothetical protein Firmicute1046_1460 [uncultured Firmicutes bacterium]
MKNQLILEKQDMTYLSWSKIRNSSGTAGSFLKSYSELGGTKTYYKLSDYDTVKGIVGHECVNELIADRLLSLLGVEHLGYRLIHADVMVNNKVLETYLCASEDFKQRNESKVALDAYYESEKNAEESPMEFCVRLGWEKYIYEMLAIDYLILNRDRHGANIEVLRNSQKRTLRLAPLFDHGISLLSRCRTEKEIENFDVLADKPVQCFVGSRSARDNLNLIPKDKLPKFNKLKITDKDMILDGLKNVISQKLQDKIWDMIWSRWCKYEDFCHTK